MIVVNTDFVPGRKIKEALGLVRGNTIQAKHLGKDIVAGFRKHLLQCEIARYETALYP